MSFRRLSSSRCAGTFFGCLLLLALGAVPASKGDTIPTTELVYPGYDIPGYGRKVVLISGDQEYRSEETLPQLARILAQHHGYHCRVLFTQKPDRLGIIDPEQGATNVPGLEALETADLLILAVRFLDLPDSQMEALNAYLLTGRPVLGLRTTNHGFQISADKKWGHYDWQYGEKEDSPPLDQLAHPGWVGGFGQVIFGGKFIDHHGWKMNNATRGILNPAYQDHAALNGLTETPIFGPSFVYGINTPLRENCEVLVHGQVLATMEPESKPLGPGPYEHSPKSLKPDAGGKNDPMMPVAWTTEYQLPDGGRPGVAFHCTMGASQDFESEGVRRLIVNGVYWLTGIDPQPDGTNVDLVGEFEASDYGFRRGDAWQERGLSIATFAHDIEPKSVRDPEHAYLDPTLGREERLYANEPVNRFRLYDFYSRQAEAMMAMPERPSLLPDFPAIDGGHFGHWGAYHKNSFDDNRNNSAATSGAIAAAFNPEGFKSREKHSRTIAFRLGDHGDLACVFDSETLMMTHVWQGDFVRFDPHRWGLGHGMKPHGDMVLSRGIKALEGEFLGYYQNGDRNVLEYRLMKKTRVLEHPWAGPDRLIRTFEFPDGVDEKISLHFPSAAGSVQAVSEGTGNLEWEIQEHRVVVTKADVGAVLVVESSWSDAGRKEEPGKATTPSSLVEGGKDLWPWIFKAQTILAARTWGPYVQDEIPVPHQNPYGAPVVIGGVAFFDDTPGKAAISTYLGDVWLVDGLADEKGEVRWKRFATGLNHALGVEVIDGKVIVLGRDRLTRLHDFNNDGCADYYENFSEAFEPSHGGHSFYVGLQKDAENNLYFTASTKTVKVSADGQTSTDLNAGGQRNPNGVGASQSGLVWTSANEGDWTPASLIWEINNPDDFCGRGAKADGPAIAPPMVFVPRGIDNSTGGQIHVEDDRWGLPAGVLLSTSFGNGDLYGILRDTHWLDSDPAKGRTQGTIFTFPFDFSSGTHRGRFGPHDGQLYLVGGDGWGNYASSDGFFSRIRYLGGAETKLPVASSAHENGVVITLNEPLDPASVTVANFLVQEWRYQFSEAYGCRELSRKNPGQAGHDLVGLADVTLSEDGRELRLAIPEIAPVECLHVHARLRTRTGEEFLLDTFHTLLHLDDAHPEMASREKPLSEKERTLELDIKFVLSGRDLPWSRNRFEEGTTPRKIRIESLSGLKYDQTLIEAKAGEPLAIEFRNDDALMPHNLVFVKPGKAQAVGQLSDQLLVKGMEAAAKRHYVPDSDDVLFHTGILVHNRRGMLYVHAPKEPGDYPYLCTYPGHWGVMRGVMRVTE